MGPSGAECKPGSVFLLVLVGIALAAIRSCRVCIGLLLQSLDNQAEQPGAGVRGPGTGIAGGESESNMRIVVTGAGGLLGSELCRQLGDDAVPLRRADLDITDADEVTHVLSDIRPHAVLNAAAYTLVDRAESEPDVCRAVNVAGVRHLAEACRLFGCPLVQISTDYVFGGEAPRREPYRETDEPAPRGVYACSKLDGEHAAAEYRQYLIVRTCGLFGRAAEGTGRSHFVDYVLHAAATGKSLRVVADQRCSPSYAPHVARAVLHLLATRRRGIYHVVNSGATTWFEFARQIVRQAELRATIEPTTTTAYGAAAPRPVDSALCTHKYHQLGGPSLPTWQEALLDYLCEHRQPICAVSA
jgi:dTDP-4-dehydrorhamnose reductase